MTVKLYCGDCLDILTTLEAGSIDAIITDLPYGTTQCAWDTVIPFEPMWAQVKRLLKPKSAFVTTASQPFTSALVMSNPKWFKYEWIWEKSRKTGFLDCEDRPLKGHENVLVFCEGKTVYNPEMKKGKSHSRGGARTGPAQVYGNFSDRKTTGSNLYYPHSIIYHPVVMVPKHPTEKPLSLYQYLIATYTNPGDTVMDFCMGSGTTGEAAVKLGRNFVGVEQVESYFDIAQRRIAEAEMQPALLQVES